MLKSLLILVLALMATTIATAQVFNFHPKWVGHTQGLSQVGIWDVTQDKYGFMWIATMDGLNRFDGYTCHVFRNKLGNKGSLSNNGVSKLLALRSGEIAAGTLAGQLDIFSYTTGTFQHYRLDDDPAKESAHVMALWENTNGEIWAANKHGDIYVLDRQKPLADKVFASILTNSTKPLHAKQSFWVDAQGQLWLCSGTRGLLKINPVTRAVAYMPMGELKGMAPDDPMKIKHIMAYRGDSALLIGEYGIGWWIGAEERFVLLDSTEEVIWVPGVDDKGKIWLPQQGDIWIWHPQEGDKRSPIKSEVPGLGLFFFKDPSGMIWGRCDLGVVYFDPLLPFQTLRPDPTGKGLTPVRSIYDIQSLPDDPDRVAFTGHGGFTVLDLKTGETMNARHPNETLALDQLFPINADSFLVTAMKLNVLTLKQTRAVDETVGKLLPNVTTTGLRALGPSSGGKVWVGGDQGMFRLDPRKYQALDTVFWNQAGPPMGIPEVILEDVQGRVFAGGPGGLYCYDRKHQALNRIEVFPGRNVPVKAVASDGEYLYVGTNGYGLVILRIPASGPVTNPQLIGQFTSESGLPDNVIYAVEKDRQGCLWLSSNRGITRMDAQRGTILNFDADWGLQNLEFNTGASWQDAKGRIFLGGINGLTWFDPAAIQIAAPRHAIHISRLLQPDTEPLLLDPSGEQVPVLKEGKRSFSVEFMSTDYFSATQNRFKYRIVELRQEWLDLGTAHRIDIPDIGPGTYTLEIQGTDRYGQWAALPCVQKFRVGYFWYETLGFKAALGLLGLLGILGFISLRLRAARRRNQWLQQEVDNQTAELRVKTERIEAALTEREVLLREIHHRVKNNLEVISSLLNLQARTFQDRDLYGSFQESRSRIQTMALIHQRLYQHETLSEIDFQEYLVSLVDGIEAGYSPPGLQLTKEVDAGGAMFDIDTAVPLGLIVNELVTNTLKYAFPERSAGRLEVKLKLIEAGTWELLVVDDGIGMPEAQLQGKRKSLGLRLVEDLTRQLQGKLTLNSGPSLAGTTILITFKTTLYRKQKE